jgi:hypothetical protein
MNTRIFRAITTIVVPGGIAATGLGVGAGTAQAEPYTPPTYHWCPDEFWYSHWGFNWGWLFCHDDWHRDYGAGHHWGGGRR